VLLKSRWVGEESFTAPEGQRNLAGGKPKAQPPQREQPALAPWKGAGSIQYSNLPHPAGVLSLLIDDSGGVACPHQLERDWDLSDLRASLGSSLEAFCGAGSPNSSPGFIVDEGYRLT
jgi:hypothetical protein